MVLPCSHHKNKYELPLIAYLRLKVEFRWRHITGERQHNLLGHACIHLEWFKNMVHAIAKGTWMRIWIKSVWLWINSKPPLCSPTEARAVKRNPTGQTCPGVRNWSAFSEFLLRGISSPDAEDRTRTPQAALASLSRLVRLALIRRCHAVSDLATSGSSRVSTVMVF